MDKKEFEWKKWDEVKDTLKINEMMIGYMEKEGVSRGTYAIGILSYIGRDIADSRCLYDLTWGNFFVPNWVMSFEEFKKR